MLKRQRPSSPVSFPDATYPTNPSDDILERVAKRRRHLVPSQTGYPHNGDQQDDDGEEDDYENGGWDCRTEYSKERSLWLDQAGEYKAANSLLHDLHAEQRHRMIFSSSTMFSSPPDPHQAHFLSNSQSHTQWANLSKHGPFLDDAMVAAQSPQHSKYAHIDNAVSSSYQEDQDVDEVRCVTHRYEDTNRLLGSLFLSRRRRLDISQDPGSSA